MLSNLKKKGLYKCGLDCVRTNKFNAMKINKEHFNFALTVCQAYLGLPKLRLLANLGTISFTHVTWILHWLVTRHVSHLSLKQNLVLGNLV